MINLSRSCTNKFFTNYSRIFPIAIKGNKRFLSSSSYYSNATNISNTTTNITKNIKRLFQKESNYNWLASCAIIGSIFLTLNKSKTYNEPPPSEETTIFNWSGTHKITPKHYYEPETIQELKEILSYCTKYKIKIRPVGSALSPNGISFSNVGMINLVQLDKILNVDMENMTVTVQAGARVSQVLEELRRYNLTLPNLASIAEQQMGGIIQVGAHGTGAKIPPIDQFVTQLKLLTPGLGELSISPSTNPIIFNFIKVGLGSLGIVTEITMRVIPCHYLKEHTFVLSRKEAIEKKDELLKKHKHVRYMWIPYEDCVVVVTNDPIPIPDNTFNDTDIASSEQKEKKFEPFYELLKELYTEQEYKELHIESMGFGDLRDAVLHTPSIPSPQLNLQNIKRCNAAEAKFWKNNQGYIHKPSDQLLQFDCGGQQWVYEVCFGTGKYNENNNSDMNFMMELLERIEREHIPAPAPIEQRWSSSSTSFMSPAHSENENDLFSWVGIIMYLPIDDGSNASDSENEIQKNRNLITKTFRETYCKLLNHFGYKSPYHVVSHWAKLELPTSKTEIQELKKVMSLKYPMKEFKLVKDLLDPFGLLSNDVISTLFDDEEDVIDDIIRDIDDDVPDIVKE